MKNYKAFLAVLLFTIIGVFSTGVTSNAAGYEEEKTFERNGVIFTTIPGTNNVTIDWSNGHFNNSPDIEIVGYTFYKQEMYEILEGSKATEYTRESEESFSKEDTSCTTDLYSLFTNSIRIVANFKFENNDKIFSYSIINYGFDPGELGDTNSNIEDFDLSEWEEYSHSTETVDEADLDEDEKYEDDSSSTDKPRLGKLERGSLIKSSFKDNVFKINLDDLYKYYETEDKFPDLDSSYIILQLNSFEASYKCKYLGMESSTSIDVPEGFRFGHCEIYVSFIDGSREYFQSTVGTAFAIREFKIFTDKDIDEIEDSSVTPEDPKGTTDQNNNSTENKSSDNKASENKATENNSTEAKKTDNKTSDSGSSVTKTPATTENVENKTTENKTTENKTTEVKPVETIVPENSTETTTSVGKVKSLKLKNKKSKKVTVSFKKISGAKYQVQYSTSKKFKKGNKTKTVSKNSVTISKLKKNKKYYFRVRAFKTVNGEKITGKWSSVKSVKIKK